MGCGGIFLGTDLLNLIESSSNHSSPQVTNDRDISDERRKPTVNNIIINNYNGNVLKNITNLEPYAGKNMQNDSKQGFTGVSIQDTMTPKF